MSAHAPNFSQQNFVRLNLKSYLCIRISAPVAELVDAPDLGSGCLRSAGSSPVRRTSKKGKALMRLSLL